jgi:bifunctional UDP-N-acetylglucosamine pyrophosphorylase/glucosamine-1-phosphate N-acetyltransferase
MENKPVALNVSDEPLDILILAAGLGTRMRSNTAKVLHKLGGRPLISHVIRAAAELTPRTIYVVVGHQADAVKAVVGQEVVAEKTFFVHQVAQRGTGDAVSAAREALSDANSILLVLSGDVPLISEETLSALVQKHRDSGAACTLLSVELPNPTGYGRIIRGATGEFERIVEQKDASEEERRIREINAGIYCFNTRSLFPALANVEPANAQGEYYLTDVPGILRAEGSKVGVFAYVDAMEVSGINTRAELAEFELRIRERTISRLMLDSGVTFIDPSHTYVSADANFGRDCVIYPDVHIEGSSVIGADCEIRSGSRITNSRLGNGVTVKDHCVIVDSEVGDNCSVGPFAHLRMGTVLEEKAVVGNFVEMKKSRLGRESKSMHLTYLGDATIGSKTNIGAGTITANYDGKNKHPTVIEDRVKIGSDTVLVAPVRVGTGAVTGAGSIVTKDVEANTLVAGVPAKVKKHLNEEEEAAGHSG